MEKKKRTKAASMEDLIPDVKRRNEVMRRLYNNESLLGQGGIFTDMLQSMINAALESGKRSILMPPQVCQQVTV